LNLDITPWDRYVRLCPDLESVEFQVAEILQILDRDQQRRHFLVTFFAAENK
jgi:hypothetical protein